MIQFIEHQSTNYRDRTIVNASADCTIAVAIDFSTTGELLTKNSVLKQDKLFIPIGFHTGMYWKQELTYDIGSCISLINGYGIKTLNIAGNGIYTLKCSQENIDEFVFHLLSGIVADIDNPLQSIRSGGQTGIDEAGLKAAVKLGIPAICLAPKGWKFRDADGIDIADEQLFKERFKS